MYMKLIHTSMYINKLVINSFHLDISYFIITGMLVTYIYTLSLVIDIHDLILFMIVL